MNKTVIHRLSAIHLLEDGQPHKLRVWKIQTGDILVYPRAVAIGKFTRGGNHRVRLLPSNEIREFRDVTLHEIDDLKIYW